MVEKGKNIKMNEVDIKKWICNKLNIQESYKLENLYNNSFALNYLLVWTIFERTNFDKFMQVSKIKKFAKSKKYFIYELENEFNNFYNRYKISVEGNQKRKGLCNQEECDNSKCSYFNNCHFLKILKKSSNKITAEDKIYFLVYIIYRYRNNMFHGSKELETWEDYREQIEECINIMMKLSD